MRKKFKVRPVDMCIYIDEHIYEEDHDVAKIYEYLQCLFYSLSMKKRFFNKESDYENYSLFAATEVYLRLVSKKQFLPDDDPRKLKKIKSILNYIKHVMYPLKVNYQQQEYSNAFKEDHHEDDDVSEVITNSLYDSATESNRDLLQVNVELYLKDISKLISSVVNETYYGNDKLISHKLYMSCLITLLKAFTLSRHNIERLFDENNTLKMNSDKLLESAYYEEMLTAPTAFHLDNEMNTYINVLVNKIKKQVVIDIREMIDYYQPSKEVVQDILAASIVQYKEGDSND